MQRVLTVLVLASLALAGCTGGKNGNAEPEPEFEGLGLEATETTGIIRGVAVDSAVRPVAGVAVLLNGAKAASTTTGADGLFGFDALDPGTYFLSASKPGFASVQQSVEVQAGVKEPPIVKVLLAADATTAPTVETFIFEGYIECSVSFVAAGFAACNTLEDQFNDNFDVLYNLDRAPQFIQSEMHWTSTQAVSPNLGVVWSNAVEGQTLAGNWEEDAGTSPLLLKADAARIAEVGLGTTMDCYNTDGEPGCLYMRIFNAPIEGTDPGCIERPGLGGCTTGLGATVEQKFTVITNLFYGIAPPEGWLYAVDGPYRIPG